jgi:hypothetical protein
VSAGAELLGEVAHDRGYSAKLLVPGNHDEDIHRTGSNGRMISGIISTRYRADKLQDRFASCARLLWPA